MFKFVSFWRGKWRCPRITHHSFWGLLLPQNLVRLTSHLIRYNVQLLFTQIAHQPITTTAAAQHAQVCRCGGDHSLEFPTNCRMARKWDWSDSERGERGEHGGWWSECFITRSRPPPVMSVIPERENIQGTSGRFIR